MTRSIRVPRHVIESKISASAKMLWIEYSLISTPKNPQVFVPPEEMAQKMNLAVSTIRRSTTKLLKAGLLVQSGIFNKRCKIYKLIWEVEAQKPIEPVPMPLPTPAPAIETEQKPFPICKRFSAEMYERLPPDLQIKARRILGESRTERELNYKMHLLLKENKQETGLELVT